MNRRHFLIGPAAGWMARAARPNVVFVLADQWRAQTLPSSGDRQLQAPNLARLATGGVHFDRVYAAYPLCAPSRAAILTGKYPHACGVTGNTTRLRESEPSLARSLNAAGYATAYIGKWDLDGDSRPGFVPPGPRRHGFGYWAAFNRGHRYFDSIYFRDDPTPIRMKGFEPDYQTALAVEFIKQNRQSPFFLYLSWGPPHTPRTPPDSVKGLYHPRQFALRENVPLEYEEKARVEYAGYYGLCTALDRCLGILLKAIGAEGLAENTIVVFTADHGDMLGSQALEYKNQPYEESARVPLLVRYPKALPRGTRSDLLFSNVDLMPTLLGLCGAEIPNGVQGRNLAALWRGEKGARPESILAEGKMESEEEWRMIVRGLDKMVIDRNGDVTHLYNLGQDPFEMNNNAASPGHRRTRDELTALLADLRRRALDGRTGSGLRTRG